MKKDSLILILDDDPDLCVMIKMMLDYNGYATVEAGNEDETRKILSEKPIDLIIMDMLLSGTHGTDISRQTGGISCQYGVFASQRKVPA
jgi:DNA-binding response OmpR family regulator